MNKGHRKKNVYRNRRRTKIKFHKNRMCEDCGRRMWSPNWKDVPKGEPKLEATCDHIYPKSKGGTDDLDNLRIICLECNKKKGAAVPA